MRGGSSFWDLPGKHELLERLAAEHRSAQEIANLLGCSRNAVIGRAHRTGIEIARQNSDGTLYGEGKAVRRLVAAAPKLRGAFADAVARAIVRRAKAKKRPAEPEAPPPRPKAKAKPKPAKRSPAPRAPQRPVDGPPAGPVHFLERRGWQCVWPLWSHPARIGEVCGEQAVAGSPYCQRHQALASGGRARVDDEAEGRRSGVDATEQDHNGKNVRLR